MEPRAGGNGVSDISNESVEAGQPASSLAAPSGRLLDGLDEIRQDGIVYFVMGCYALMIWALSIYLNNAQKYRPFQYILGWALLSLLFLATIWAVRATRIDSRRPFSAFLAIVRRHWQRGLIWRLPLILATAIFYGTFTSAKNMLPDIHPFTWDATLAAIDYQMLGGHDGWKLVASVIPDGVPLQILDMIYTKVWLFLMLGLCAYVSLSSDFRHLRTRFLLAFSLGWVVAGNILAGFFMSGGPCFYAHFTRDNLRFAELLHSVASTGSAAEQNYLWSAYLSGQGWLAGGISAFPSVHLVTIVVLTLLLKKMDIRLFWVGVILTVLMEIGSVRLGWHYVTDGLVGIAVGVFAWYLAGVVSGTSSRGEAQA